MPKPVSPPSQAALRAHHRACLAGEAGYIDPQSKLFVLTSIYLKEQGACCGNGCRHCPWPPAAQRESGRDPLTPCWPFDPQQPPA